MATRMQQRRGTASEWASVNPVLGSGEIGFEADSSKFKFGDGVNVWSDLPYFSDAQGILGVTPETLDTLGELAAAIDNDPDFYNSVANSFQAIDDALALARTDSQDYANQAVLSEAGTRELADIALAADIETLTADLSTESGARELEDIALNGMIEALSLEVTSLGEEISLETSTRQSEIGTLSGEVETLSISFATELEALATQTGLDIVTQAGLTLSEAALAAEQDATAKADAAELAAKNYADNSVDAHNSDTTSVHGIADTSLLATTTDVSTAQTAAELYADGLAINYDAAGTAVIAQAAAEGHADSVVSTHNSATTSVHGIADTSDLALLSANTQTFSGDIVISGDLVVSGTTTTIDTANFQTTDPLIYLGEGNVGNAADLGFVANFNDGTYQHTGLARDASANTWKLFVGITDEPTATLNFAQGGLDDLAVNNLTAAGVVFSDGAQTKVGVPSITEISQKTASYTLSSISERDTLIEVNSSSATTITVPDDQTVDFPIGTTLDVLQVGSGQVTFAGAVGVTVNATPGLKLRTQWSSVTLLKRAANSWVVYGDLSA